MSKKVKLSQTVKAVLSWFTKCFNKIKTLPRKQLIILSSILFVILVSIILIPLLLPHNTTSDTPITKAIPTIALPESGGFVEAWTPLLSQIAEAGGFSQVTITTYNDAKTLENLFAKADQYNLLWAEIPLEGQYNFDRLISKDYFEPITNINGLSYLQPISKAIATSIPLKGTNQEVLPCLPLSHNPWFLLSHKELPETVTGSRADYVYSIAGKDFNTAFATLAAARSGLISNSFTLSTGKLTKLPITEQQNEQSVSLLPTVEDGTKLLYLLSNNGIIQNNANSYTPTDSKNLFIDGHTAFWFLSTKEYNTIHIVDCSQFIIETNSQILVTDITAAFFPSRQNERAKSVYTSLQRFLTLPDVQYQTANHRLCLPAVPRTIARSVYTDNIQQFCLESRTAIIPLMQYNINNYSELLADINKSLTTLKANAN